MNTPVIELDDVTKSYGSRRGLSGVTLTVGEGEIFGYLGPNGAGKSTTIRLLLDLIRPTSGRIRVLGRDPRQAGTAARRDIGYLPGTLTIQGNWRVGSLLDHFADLRGGVSRDRIDGLCDRLGLDQDARIRALSKGNKQKVGIVQAFMHQPRLLIFDEPTSGLDPLLQHTFLEMVREANDDGATVLMSSHVLTEVQEVAGRVGIVRDGRLIAVEQVEDLRAKALRQIRAVFPEAPAARDAYQSLLTEPRWDGPVLTGSFTGPAALLLSRLAQDGCEDFLCTEPSLESLFFHYYEDGAR